MAADNSTSSIIVTACAAAASSAAMTAALMYLLPKYWPCQHSSGNQSQQTATTHGCSKHVYSHGRETQQQQQQQLCSQTASRVKTANKPDPYDPRPRYTYLSWDDYFMAVAFLSAERSKDPNKQVGACIVSDDNIILSIGYNGFPRGCPDKHLPWSKRGASGSILDTKYPYVVHAEANALLNKNQAHVTGARIYVTLFPCNECAKLLIQAGIKEVVYHEAKLEPTGKRPAIMEQAAAADAAADALADAQQQQLQGQIQLTCEAPQQVGGSPRQQFCSSRQSHCSSSTGSISSDVCAHWNHNGACAAAAGHKQKVSGCASSSSSSSSSSDGSSMLEVTTQQQQTLTFGVGAPTDLDASYLASQRLLSMAGVKLRQHTLQRRIHLGPEDSRNAA